MPSSFDAGFAHAAGALERLEDEAALDLAEHRVELAPLGGSCASSGAGLADRPLTSAGDRRGRSRPRRERDRALHHVLELADVARETS